MLKGGPPPRRRRRPHRRWGLLAAALAGLLVPSGLVARRFLAMREAVAERVVPVERPGVVLAASPTVAILRASCPAPEGAPEAEITAWRARSLRLGAHPEVVTEDALPAAADVLVLPSARCLGDGGRAFVLEHLRQGRGVVATWAPGSRDRDGQWVGWDFVQEITGADSVRLLPVAEKRALVFGAGSPLTGPRSAATRARVNAREALVASALSVDAHWAGPRLFPENPEQAANLQGAALRSTGGCGRVAWLGVRADAGATRADQDVLDEWLDHALAWVAGGVLVRVEPWPWPYQAASVVAVDVDQQPQRALDLADGLAVSHVRGTFFVPPDLARGTDLPHLAATADVGWLPRQHLAESSWRVALAVERARLAAWRAGAPPPRGVHPPPGEPPPRSLLALGAGGFSYWLADGEAESALPQVMRASTRRGLGGERYLARLARSTDDDLHLSPLGFWGLEPAWLIRRLRADAAAVHDLGGLYVLGAHTSGLGSPQYGSVLPAVTQAWTAAGVWVGSGAEVAAWAVGRATTTLDVRRVGTGLELTVRTGPYPLDGACLSVAEAPGATLLRALPLDPGTGAPRVVRAAGRTCILPGRLAPARDYRYRLETTVPDGKACP